MGLILLDIVINDFEDGTDSTFSKIMDNVKLGKMTDIVEGRDAIQ